MANVVLPPLASLFVKRMAGAAVTLFMSMIPADVAVLPDEAMPWGIEGAGRGPRPCGCSRALLAMVAAGLTRGSNRSDLRFGFFGLVVVVEPPLGVALAGGLANALRIVLTFLILVICDIAAPGLVDPGLCGQGGRQRTSRRLCAPCPSDRSGAANCVAAERWTAVFTRGS